ncbi:MAG: lamin tail domain-containing protein [Candidatus Poseidoniaceae archaeon]
MRRMLVALILVTALFPIPVMSQTDDNGGIVIEEILVSASSAQYNGTDWNGDGDIGSFSDQYIMITNTGTDPVDISDWILDDTTNGGSPPCRIGWNTTIEGGESITFYRANTDIELDYWDGDTATLMNAEGNLIDSMTYPGEDSWWDKVYIIAENGSLWKTDPNPAERQGTCFTESDNTEDSYILKGRIVPMTGEGDVIENGNIMIEGSKIVAIWADGEIPPINTDNVSAYDTGATIYPGLIDLHNHMHYNHIPLWDFNVHLSDSQKSEEGGYTNRYQWGNNWDYGPSITWMKNNVQQRSRWDMSAEQMKYAEVQAVAGGVTAVQGSPGSGTDAWDSMLSRNIELYNFGQDGISTCAVCGAADDDYTGNHLISQNQSGSLNAWFVHLSEGVDQSSKAEFDALWNKGLIMDETVVIHGTGMDASQFNQMGTTGAGLVWSPFSNLVLYGDTTDVVAADNAGITISIAPDWGPSGTKNNLHELKVADMWNREILQNHFSDYELAEMVTSNPAEISNWEAFVGQLKTDMYADIVVIDTFHENPYRNLIEAIDPDVRLTIVHGKPVFGDIDLMSAMKGDDWEYINGSGFSKAIDVTSTSDVDGMQTWEEIESGLSMAMRNDFNDIKANWDDVEGMTDSEIEDWLGSNFDGDYKDNVNRLSTVGLDPIYTIGDDRFFDVVNRSGHANYHIDMTKLYDYYDVEYNADGNRAFIEDSNYTVPVDEPDPIEGCTDSTATNYNSNADTDDGSCEFDNGGDNPDNNATGGDTCVGICDEDVSDQAESDGTDPVFALTVVMVIIFLAAITVIIVSKDNEDGKDIHHEEINDDFIPELPPLEPPKD